MAISTYKAFLMVGTESSGQVTWEKLVDIKTFPDLGGAPERLQTTTLSDKARTYIKGIQDTEDLVFSGNYDKADYAKVLAYDTSEEYNFAVWLGGTESGGTVTPDGSEGKFSFKGMLSVYVNGGGVNEVVDMTITLTPSTVITPTVS